MSRFLQNRFRKKKLPESPQEVNEVVTIPVQVTSTAEETPAPAQLNRQEFEPPQFVVGCGQSVGQQRDQNEDALFTLTTNLVTNDTQVPFGLYIVADGMGGHRHGEVASSMAVRALAGYIIRKLYLPLFSLSNTPPDEAFQDVLQEGIQEAHRTILRLVPGSGTTLTAALIVGDQMTIAHVGDCRAYLIGGADQVEVLTRDHSLVNRMVELGQLSPEEASTHPQRNVVYRAIGQGEPVEPDILIHPLPASSCLLICSDGLWGVIDQTMLVRIALSSPSPHEACQKMIRAANEAGGPDNITAILVKKVS